jgi:hypothetical protein
MNITRQKLASLLALIAGLILMTAAPANGAGYPPVFLPLIEKSMSGMPCPQWVHDLQVVKGPDGKTYPTWHPAVDVKYGCNYDHEHGDDPRRSLADNTLPAFGYIGMNMVPPMNEPHVGFKVFVQNKGTVNEEGRKLINSSSRAVVHMGTGGAGRLTERFHSLEYDFIADNGQAVHVQGMADTGEVVTECNLPEDPSAVTRRIVEVPSSACQPQSTYEVWQFRLRFPGIVTINVGTAVFDPVTVMNLDRASVSPTAEHFSFTDVFKGCDRESYQHSPYLFNDAGPQVFYTDPMGMHINSAFAAQMPLRQVVSRGTGLMQRSADGQTLFKHRTRTCGPGLKAPN